MFGLPFPTYLVWFIVPLTVLVSASTCFYYYLKIDKEEKARAAEKRRQSAE